MKQSRTWIDERGKIVVICPFFSKIFSDEETRKLDQEYKTRHCDGQIKPSSLGQLEKEEVTAALLGLTQLVKSIHFHLVGVLREELECWESEAQATGSTNFLVSAGFLREKWVRGELVVFPTDKLLSNQKIPKRTR